MHLFLLRHAIAVSRGTAEYPNDDRPLTEEGQRKMKKAAQGIFALGLDVDVILTSPLIRAAATAAIVAHALEATDRIITSDALRPETPPETLFAEINQHKDKKSFLLVGHEPDLCLLATNLLGAPDLDLKFKKGGLCHIEIDKLPPVRPGTLIWHVTPAQLRLMGKAGARAARK